MRIHDFKVTGHGSIYLIHPRTTVAAQWLRDTAPDDAQWWGEYLAVEHRYIGDVMAVIQDTCNESEARRGADDREDPLADPIDDDGWDNESEA
jgi:hypothetical protein